MSYFVFTVKSVDLAVVCDGFLLGIVCIFIVATLMAEAFSQIVLYS